MRQFLVVNHLDVVVSLPVLEAHSNRTDRAVSFVAVADDLPPIIPSVAVFVDRLPVAADSFTQPIGAVDEALALPEKM